MSHFVTLTCPSCGAKASVGEGQGRYQCEYCGNEHLLKNAHELIQPSGSLKLSPFIPVPASVKVENNGMSARLVQRWFSAKYLAMLVFLIPWNAFLCFWYSMAFGAGVTGSGSMGGLPWLFFVIPLGHLAIGVGLTYSTLAGFFNRTIVELTPGQLSVWFEPIPWLGAKTINTQDIQQFYCQEKVTHGRRGSTRYQYELHLITRENRQEKLVGNIESPDIALFFEQQLETWMRISDQPVVGELGKG